MSENEPKNEWGFLAAVPYLVCRISDANKSVNRPCRMISFFQSQEALGYSVLMDSGERHIVGNRLVSALGELFLNVLFTVTRNFRSLVDFVQFEEQKPEDTAIFADDCQ